MAADPNALSSQLRAVVDRVRNQWQIELKQKTSQLAEINLQAQELQARIDVLQSWIDGTDATVDVVVPADPAKVAAAAAAASQAQAKGVTP